MNINEPQFQIALAERVNDKVFRGKGITDGHVHFYISGHHDHIILLCSRSEPGTVIVKSPDCKKGEGSPWNQSSFAAFNRECFLQEVARKISMIRIDCGGCNKSWSGLNDFLRWLGFESPTTR